MTTDARRAARVTIPADFPNAHRLAGRDVFLAILGNPSIASFNRMIARGDLPKPRKLGHLNRWTEAQMAAARDAALVEAA